MKAVAISVTAAVLVLVGLGGLAGGVAGTATQPHQTSLAPVFPWVPAGGFPTGTFPTGQCTWWAAYNHPVTWKGNAGDWIANASAQGVPISSTPSVGAVVVYAAGRKYSVFGHVALVTAVSPGAYTISEMNYVGEGKVDTRTIPWPDPDVIGFIPYLPGGGA